MAATSIATSLIRRAVVTPLLRSGASLPRFSSRAYVVIPRAVAKQSNKASVSVSSKGGRFASSKVTAADENLKNVIGSEIEAVEQSDYYKQKIDVPEKFPFEIIDTPGEQAVVLKREFEGEVVKATIFADFEESPEDYEDEDEEEDEADEDEEAEGDGGRPALSVVVTVEKGEGPFLEFVCNFNEEGYAIESMLMKTENASENENAYQGPEFADLDEGLQEAVRKYLEVRGIRHSLFNFLTEYMLNKEEREYIGWLKNMKSFISQ